jgi:hypothetical protein
MGQYTLKKKIIDWLNSTDGSVETGKEMEEEV